MTELRIFDISNRTIGFLLEARARELGEHPYLLFEDETYSYMEALQEARRAASALLDLGVRKGDRVALMLENSPQFLWIVMGLGLLGAVGVPLNTAAKGRQLHYFLKDSTPRLVVAEDRVIPEMRRAATDLRIVAMKKSDRGDEASFEDAIAHAEALPSMKGPDFFDTALIPYTSGTTGPSKGVVSPHSHGLSVGLYAARGHAYAPEDRIYISQPLFHAGPLWWGCYAALWSGATIVLARRFSAKKFWSDIHKYQATSFNAIMSMVEILRKLPPSELEMSNPVQHAYVAPMPRPRLEFEQRAGLVLTTSYALSELHTVAQLRRGDGYDREGTAGRLCDHDEVQIRDGEDMVLPPGQIGEITVRPREPWTTFTEYWRQPEATVRAFRNLWFHTGDRGHVDEDGYLFFVGRQKDTIRRRGENISAFEVEQIIDAHPQVLMSAVVGVPAELGEQDVAVYVVPRSPELREEDIILFAREQMAYYMVPRYVKLVRDLPRTATHKVKKYELVEEAARDLQALWDREQLGIQVTRDTTLMQTQPSEDT